MVEESGGGEMDEVVPEGGAGEQANEGDERVVGPLTVMPERRGVRRWVSGKEAPGRIDSDDNAVAAAGGRDPAGHQRKVLETPGRSGRQRR